MPQQSIKILSVGGSIIIPKTGFDIAFLKAFRKLILGEIKKGQKFIITIGGGAICRQYQEAARQVNKPTNDDLDWIGIHSTIFNAQFVRFLFKDVAYKDVITDPRKKVKTSQPLIIGAGWKPGCSTDNDAVLLAKTYGAKELFNLSNISMVYDKDPHQYTDAKPVERIDWKSFRRDIVGNTWDPGKSAPFDPIASKTAEKLGLTVNILQGTNLVEVKKALAGRKFVGTVIC